VLPLELELLEDRDGASGRDEDAAGGVDDLDGAEDIAGDELGDGVGALYERGCDGTDGGE
jgi:hypothetical protein